ncbi:hypothetical protein BGZ91_006700 [Linnemannia elongata]|nr:hypothetical protein BGZ91_006700 [Linnemannia elongata]
MMLKLSSMLVLVATILGPTAAIVPGPHIIHSVAAKTQVIAVPPGPPTAPVGVNQGNVPLPFMQWDIQPFQRGYLFLNKQSGKFLSLVGTKVVLDAKPIAWNIVEEPGKFEIVAMAGTVVGLTGPQNGAPLDLNPDRKQPPQQWVFQHL